MTKTTDCPKCPRYKDYLAGLQGNPSARMVRLIHGRMHAAGGELPTHEIPWGKSTATLEAIAKALMHMERAGIVERCEIVAGLNTAYGYRLTAD